MTANELYKDYDKRVQEYMNNVITCLENDYGKIPESWRISLDLIADNYAIYLNAKDEIKANGLFKVDNQNRKTKNQAIYIMNVAQMHLKDLMKSFALTPVSKAKMRSLRSSNEMVDETDYIESLTK